MIVKILGEAYVPDRKNVYELQVKYMGGDANAYFTNSFYYDLDETDELHFNLHGLDYMLNDMPKRLDKQYEAEHIMGFFEKLGYESVEDEDEDSDTYLEMLPHEQVKTFLETFCINDDTDETYEYNAKVVEIKLFYYNGDGKKFNAEYTK